MIIPSVLSENERVMMERIELARTMSGWVHVDILDNTLYPGHALSLEQLKTCDFGDLFLEFHCMTTNPLAIVESGLSVDRLIIHYELPMWQEVYKELVHHGVNVWLAVDPSTDVKTISLPQDVNGITLMGVNPGKGGQTMLPETFDRLQVFREYYSDIPITVDGGVTGETIRDLLALGVDNLVMGAAIFNNQNPVEAYKRYVQLSDPIGGAL